MILGRDDPKFGARILRSFFFAWETSFRRWKNFTHFVISQFEFVKSQNKLDFVISQIRFCDINKSSRFCDITNSIL